MSKGNDPTDSPCRGHQALLDIPLPPRFLLITLLIGRCGVVLFPLPRGCSYHFLRFYPFVLLFIESSSAGVFSFFPVLAIHQQSHFFSFPLFLWFSGNTKFPSIASCDERRRSGLFFNLTMTLTFCPDWVFRTIDPFLFFARL